MNENLKIDQEKMDKIKRKLIEIGITKISLNMKPFIEIPEFKHIIVSYKIPKKAWYQIANQFEYDGIVELHGNSGMEIKINQSIQLSSEMRMALLYLNNQNFQVVSQQNNSCNSPGKHHKNASKKVFV